MVRRCAVVRDLAIGAVLTVSAVFAVVPSSAVAATNETLYASATATNTTQPCTDSSNPCTLSAAIGEANGDAGDTIKLADGTYTSPSAGFPAITSDQTWTGSGQSGTVLHGVSSMTAAIVTVQSGTVAIDGLTVTGGTNTTGKGGGLINSGGSLTLSADTFSHNSTVGNFEHGGAISNGSDGGDASLTVTDCTFSDNGSGDETGGAIANGDAGFGRADSQGTLTVSDSTFSGNLAFLGGAIVNGASSPNGGVGTGTMTINDSTFSGNIGSAILNGFFDNTATSGTGTPGSGTAVIRNSTFSGNGGESGGAIENGEDSGDGNLLVTGSTFESNAAANGGAIDNAEFESTGKVTIADSTFVGNRDTSGAKGGAIDNAEGGNGTMSIVASTFVGNSGGTSGTTIENGKSFCPTLCGQTTASMTLAGDVIAGASNACDHPNGTWTDDGYIVADQSDCLSGGTGDALDTSLSSHLDTLKSHGGPTETIALISPNPAIGAIPNPGPSVPQADGSSFTLCPTIDQRGVASPAGAACDSGAVQLALTEVSVTVTGSQTYGSSTPSFSTSTTPPSGDSVSGTLACTTVNGGTAIDATLAAGGSYTIDGSSCSGLSLTGPTADNYFISYNGSTFTVDRAALTVNAPSATAQYGNVPTTFTPTYTGLVNGQTAPSTAATCKSAASNTSPPGMYPITCSGASDPNYMITYGPAGTLTITKAQTKLVAAPASFGQLSITFSATLTRVDNGAGVAGKTIAFSFFRQDACHATTNSSGIATCTAFPEIVISIVPTTYTASFPGDADYVASSATGQLTTGGGTFPGRTLGPRATNTHGAVLVRASLSRAGVVYASGSGRTKRGTAGIVLKVRRPLRPGRYRLTLTGGHSQTTTRTITLT